MAPAVIPPINPGRIRILNPGAPTPGSKPGPVVYWMFRDQRSADNWALLHALHLSTTASAPVAVAFNLFHRFLGAHARQLGFMLRGLRQLAGRLDALNIPFFLLRGDAVDTIPEFVRVCGASTLVTDFSPLRSVREQKEEIVRRVGPAVGVHEVDAHNVVPVWAASAKLEYSAKTIRAKIHRLLPEYLVEFPKFKGNGVEWTGGPPPVIDWDALISEVLRYSILANIYRKRWFLENFYIIS